MPSPITHQLKLDLPLPQVQGSADYRAEKETLQAMDAIISVIGIEEQLAFHLISEAEGKGDAQSKKEGDKEPVPKRLSQKKKESLLETAQQILRQCILRKKLNISYRQFSSELAKVPLYQWFCRINRFTVVHAPSKSSLERDEKSVPAEFIQALDVYLLKTLSEGTMVRGHLPLFPDISLKECFTDTTCLEARIHIPVDWLLMRDAVRTLMKKIICIRKHSLKHRLPKCPTVFINEINNLCINMSTTARSLKGKGRRKAIFRQMKNLTKKIQKHAERYYKLLEEKWSETDLSEAQTRQILASMKRIIEQLPEARRQAHERIIGGRKIKNKDKILSLYDENVHVIVRHKSKAKVEFGNTLQLTEQEDGLIVDYQLFKDQAPGDAQLVQSLIERIENKFGEECVDALATDRGFSSKANQKFLARKGIYDAICPKDPNQCKLRMEEERFRALQKRRAQTEGRIGIIKANFTAKKLLPMSFGGRERHVSWSILAHNLWKAALLYLQAVKAPQKTKAA